MSWIAGATGRAALAGATELCESALFLNGGLAVEVMATCRGASQNMRDVAPFGPLISRICALGKNQFQKFRLRPSEPISLNCLAAPGHSPRRRLGLAVKRAAGLRLGSPVLFATAATPQSVPDPSSSVTRVGDRNCGCDAISREPRIHPGFAQRSALPRQRAELA